MLGFVWGVTCILRALTNPLWAPFVNPLVSLVPRILVGIVGGLTAQGLRKLRMRSGVVAALSAAAATLTAGCGRPDRGGCLRRQPLFRNDPPQHRLRIVPQRAGRFTHHL